ncbi:MAG: CoA-binding protein [Actinomycetota bacterium]|nr:CoA-binding protein [Actinomycetota bacterium]MDD5665904.1 CoA-binding protein [Actinomycetota bacterium]
MMDLDLRQIEVVAVVGASRDRGKFGYKVLMDLKHGGYEAYGVNPACDEIEGVPCYPDLASLPRRPDLVITVVPPEVTEKVVREAEQAGIERIWMQPGSECDEAAAYCEKSGIEYMRDACIMVFRREQGVGGR